MAHKKRPRPKKDAAHLKEFATQILAGVISGILTALLSKLLNL